MKKSYQIGNWKEYNKSLINRGSITFWFSEEIIKTWGAKKDKNHFGRPLVYSDLAIETSCIIRFFYHLPLRAAQGFLSSLASILRINISIPSYTQVCRRAQKLKLDLKLSNRKITDIVFDSSGLKVYGEGEWKMRTHGKSKRRTWRKLHIGICPKTHDIIVSELTENLSHDSKIMPSLLSYAPKGIKKVYGDKGYDSYRCFKAIDEIGAESIIPTRQNSNIFREMHHKRSKILMEIRGLGDDDIARSIWKKLKGYHRRSLVETAFYRIKTMLGPNLKSRKLLSQKIEAMLKCQIINKLNSLGMPQVI
ncbi:MAG: IS5 family transposase [Clostridiales bacterium]|nr:IS5 family transposase [Clostridiales bacterium]